ncbi:hypothetical protein GCM10010305_45380 [Streptomyces termitum]|uniref:Uncharacterized protein n=1 Tax=Streptomyces termitum TaxID=67368 RepID=A0A918WBL0_9ACTN|nr:hypothetical protein GCM10010305_45380 [Streptomyces termitum]
MIERESERGESVAEAGPPRVAGGAVDGTHGDVSRGRAATLGKWSVMECKDSGIIFRANRATVHRFR